MGINEFYETPFLHDKRESWDSLKRLGENFTLPWCICGDFNNILYVSEKIGGAPREERRMEMFQDTLSYCNLLYVGFVEPRFTWEQRNSPRTNIRERLDRVVVNKKWLKKFLDMEVRYIPSSASDHLPILLALDA